jgi:hypothetical protein
MLRAVAGASLVVVVLSLMSRDASAQVVPAPPQPVQSMSLEGPRIGATFLSPGIRARLRDRRSLDVGSVITQIGWQTEKRFLTSSSGWTGVIEGVVLAGGMEQGVVIPSLNWLMGLRTPTGVEFAIGPNLTAAGIALVAAGGVTFKAGDLNVPVNLAVVPSKEGIRVSMLAGFNWRRR